ncbi:hypothetical protein AB1E18_015632 [Capra hircus]
MVKSMKKVAGADAELTVEGRNLLSVHIKTVIRSRRASWRITRNKEENKGEDKLKMIWEYRQMVETELQLIRCDILGVLDEHLIPHRYLAEFAVRNDRKEAVENSLMAYKAAGAVAVTELPSTRPIHLGLALNFCIFYYEIPNSPEHTCSDDLTLWTSDMQGDGEERNKEALQDVEDDNR